jgi:hypothetical protein
MDGKGLKVHIIEGFIELTSEEADNYEATRRVSFLTETETNAFILDKENTNISLGTYRGKYRTGDPEQVKKIRKALTQELLPNLRSGIENDTSEPITSSNVNVSYYIMLD